jgi:glutamate dehydrogenase
VAEKGARPADVVRAFRIAREVTSADERWAGVERLPRSCERAAQWTLMEGVDSVVEAVARWYLENAPGADMATSVEDGRAGFERFAAVLDHLGSDDWRAARERQAAELAAQGIPEGMARSRAYLPGLARAPDVIAVAAAVGRSVEEAGRAFSLLDERAQIGWLEAQLDELPVRTRLQRWALQALRDDLWRARSVRARRSRPPPTRPCPRRSIASSRATPKRSAAWRASRARWPSRARPTSPG